MSDIVEWLRTWTGGNEPTTKERKAADEIERLRAALRAMREAPYEQPIGCWFGAINAALEGTNTKHTDIGKEAAAEIERLRADRKQYEEWAEEIKLNINVMQTEIERLRATQPDEVLDAYERGETDGRERCAKIAENRAEYWGSCNGEKAANWAAEARAISAAIRHIEEEETKGEHP